jgi:branched-chain amino acid transport system ATP-binding protein
MLDEPSMGLAPTISEELFATISAVNREQGLTILLVEQNAQAAMALCDYGYIIENGRIVLHGSREKLSEHEDVREFYLGLSLDSERRSFREVKHYKGASAGLGKETQKIPKFEPRSSYAMVRFQFGRRFRGARRLCG